MASKLAQGFKSLQSWVNHKRRIDPSTDEYYKFSKKNRIFGFLVEFFDPMTFLVSAPEVLLAINGIFLALGIAFWPLMLGFFALEIAFFTVIAIFMGIKYVKESGQVNKDIDEIQKLKKEIDELDARLAEVNDKISQIEKDAKDKTLSASIELENLKQGLQKLADQKRRDKELREQAEKSIKVKNRSFFGKIKHFWKSKLEEPYYRLKKKHPNIIGALHYIFNFAIAMITVTGFISGFGFLFGVSAASLGILTFSLIPIGATNPLGWAILLGGLILCAAVFMGRRMFFHAPVSEAKQRVPERKNQLANQKFEKELELEVAEKYLEKLESKLAADDDRVSEMGTQGN